MSLCFVSGCMVPWWSRQVPVLPRGPSVPDVFLCMQQYSSGKNIWGKVLGIYDCQTMQLIGPSICDLHHCFARLGGGLLRRDLTIWHERRTVLLLSNCLPKVFVAFHRWGNTLGDREATGRRQGGDRKATGKRQASYRLATGERQGGDREAAGRRQESDRQATGKQQESDKLPHWATGRRQGGDREATGGRQEDDRQATGGRQGGNRK